MAKPAGALLLKVTLVDIDPPVWRRLVFPARFTLGALHEAIQVSLGWDNSHLHEFRVGKKRFVMSAEDDDGEAADEESVSLGELGLRARSKFEYEYDFGDSWRHQIVVEKVLPEAEGKQVLCLGGERACPPEDCGGPGGYEDLLSALRRPRLAKNRELVEWTGEKFDPESFDLPTVTRGLAKIC